jgi:hypothetical protein
MTSKSTFSEKQFFGKILAQNFQHDRLVHFCSFFCLLLSGGENKLPKDTGVENICLLAGGARVKMSLWVCSRGL